MASYSNNFNNCSFNPDPKKPEGGQYDHGDVDCRTEAEKLYESTIKRLEKGKGWITEHVFNYQGIWLSPKSLKALLLLPQFKALPHDIFLATFPKSGTTWFKALIYTIINRNTFNLSSHPLLHQNPHDCFPFVEVLISEDHQLPHLDNHYSSSPPRLLATHIPYPNLSKSLSGNRIVYVARDPKDVLVSFWHNAVDLRSKLVPPLTSSFSLQEAYDLFCKGAVHTGPYWDHVLGYWNASLKSPEEVMFLTYEYMKMEPLVCIKRLAEFLGQGFTDDEEESGVLDEILRLCSFENMSKLEVNKNGVQEFSPVFAVPNKCFF